MATHTHQRICLNMIVKDEVPVIERCLASVRPWIDTWVIVDTGSSDGTQTLVQRALQGIKGELHERPWCNFAHNRNEALDLARSKADYILFIDADEQLLVPAGFRWPLLSSDGYLLTCRMNDHEYQRNALIAAQVAWRWEGVLHEYLTAPQHNGWSHLQGPQIFVSHDGARGRDPSTYLKDIAVLEDALRTEPQNTRYAFYLAQSLRDANYLEQSREAYRRRARMGGWEEEVWYSLYQVAALTERLGEPASSVRDAYLEAYAGRPNRAEPLHDLARFHRMRSEFALAHLYAQQAVQIPRPKDLLFVDASVYEWRALDELAVSAYYVNAMEQGRVAIKALLDGKKYPASEHRRMEANREFFGLLND